MDLLFTFNEMKCHILLVVNLIVLMGRVQNQQPSKWGNVNYYQNNTHINTNNHRSWKSFLRGPSVGMSDRICWVILSSWARLCVQKSKQESGEESDEGAAGGPRDIPGGSRPLLEVSIREAEAQPFEVLMQFLYTDKIQYPRRGQASPLAHSVHISHRPVTT